MEAYDISRDDRRSNDSTRGSGVLIAVHHTLSARELQVTHQCNAVFIEFKFNKKLLVIAAAYLPPNSIMDIFTEFSTCLEEVSARNGGYEFIVCADFNLAYIRWFHEPLSFERMGYIPPAQRDNANRLCQTLSLLGLHQLHSIHLHKGYSLDLLFVPNEFVTNIAIHENLISVDQLGSRFKPHLNVNVIALSVNIIILRAIIRILDKPYRGKTGSACLATLILKLAFIVFIIL